jgi:hypothetical protein
VLAVAGAEAVATPMPLSAVAALVSTAAVTAATRQELNINQP